jgi:sugar phosphate isomerase/epimerase
MNRRDFIGSASALGLAAMIPLSSCTSEEKFQPKYKLGYQLFSIRDEMEKDPIATLKALKAMEYQDFETYGYDTEKDSFYGIPSKEFKATLDDLELSVSSGHFGFSAYLEKSDEEMMRYVDGCIIGAQNTNMSYITWPWIDPEQRTLDNFKLMAQKLNKIGERVNAANLGFAYHNHGYEFEDLGGETGYDIILKDTDPNLVKLQMDMYWVMHSADFTPKDLVEKQAGRIVMWHIKDMDKETRDYTELGNGSIDYLKELPDPAKSGLEFYYVEQGGNFTHNSMKSAETSANYLKENLLQFL